MKDTLKINWYGKEIIIPKIINGHRPSKYKTKTELKKMKLMPGSEPVGYGAQQYDGSTFLLYDLNSAIPYVLSESDRILRNEYRHELWKG